MAVVVILLLIIGAWCFFSAGQSSQRAAIIRQAVSESQKIPLPSILGLKPGLTKAEAIEALNTISIHSPQLGPTHVTQEILNGALHVMLRRDDALSKAEGTDILACVSMMKISDKAHQIAVGAGTFLPQTFEYVGEFVDYINVRYLLELSYNSEACSYLYFNPYWNYTAAIDEFGVLKIQQATQEDFRTGEIPS